MKKHSSIDGFIPRRAGTRAAGVAQGSSQLKSTGSAGSFDARRELSSTPRSASETVGKERPSQLIGRLDIDDSLRSIDGDDLAYSPFPDLEPKKSRRQARKDKKAGIGVDKPKRSKAKKIILTIVILLVVAGLAVGGFLLYRLINTSNNVLQGSFLDLVQNQPLKQDANGRSNFVIFGTAEDDEGGEHGGANLTDSIMVMSVDQTKKDAYLISLPRDLWVEYQEQCTVGDYGKLNAAYFCASDDGANEAAGAQALQTKAGEITGLDIQYYIHLNFTAVVEAVDAVGGVDITIESDDPRGIYDRNFDWKCNYQCFYVNYKNGEVAHMDGEHALAFARTRNANGGYGTPNGNFDREKNQQKVIKALREKAVSAGTLTNLGAVTGLMDALGNNLRTNIETKEIRTLMDLGQNISSDNIKPLSLVEEGNMLLTTGPYNGQSIVRPIEGLLQYSEINAYINKIINATPLTREAPHVTVLNGSETAGVAQTEADKLEAAGFTIDSVDNAPDGSYGKATIYQVTADKPASAAKLKEVYGVEILTTTPPVSVVGETDFVVIIGTAAQ